MLFILKVSSSYSLGRPSPGGPFVIVRSKNKTPRCGEDAARCRHCRACDPNTPERIRDPQYVARWTEGLNSLADNVSPDRIGVSVSGPRDWDFGGHPQGELGGGFFFVLKGEDRSRAGPLRRLLDNVGPNLGGVSGDGDPRSGPGSRGREPASFYMNFDDNNVKYLLTKRGCG
jgi:hypothetical protein